MTTLVRKLTPKEENARREASPAKPRAGSPCRLWRMDGQWNIWSEGPDRGTWWLQPNDETATDAARAIAADLSAGQPVVIKAAMGCVAVPTKEIRNGGWS